MKFRIIFLKRKHIYYFVFILILLIVSVLLFLSKSTDTVATTFSVTNEDKAIKADVTGDGKQDILYIKTDKNKYHVQVNTTDNSFYLEPSKKLNTLGSNTPCWPMNITLMDISRDKTPEIFIQSSLKNVPIQHIFKWTGEKFENIFSSSNTILGFIDCSNNKTPKIISGTLSGNKIDFYNYILVNNNLQSFTYGNKENLMGKTSIFNFIKYVESLPNGEANKPSDIFSPSLSGKDIAVIGKLSGENNIYTFQDGLFMDTNWNKNGDLSEVKWTLNFRGASTLRKDELKLYTLKLTLKPDLDMTESDYLKIASIVLE